MKRDANDCRPRRSHLLVLLAAAMALSATGCAATAQGTNDIVIVNAQVIDGSGAPSRNVNVRISGERIVAVGDIAAAPNDRVIDAQGLVLAPGFIDTHSHHDDGLFEHPDALAVTNQGVTTIVAGQDGGQPFPLADFFDRLAGSPAAINVAAYAGHGTLRRQVMGDDYRRLAEPEELAEMVTLLDKELRGGALGLSSGLEYDPGSFADTSELIRLARTVGEYDGIYASHIRNEDQYFWEAVDEAIHIGRKADLPVRITHIKLAMTRWWGQTDRLLGLLEDARASGVDVSADIYTSRAWYTGFSWLATLFPDRDLTRREGADYILEDMLAPDRILIPIYTPEPGYNGLTVAEIAERRNAGAATTLMELLQADRAMGGDASGSTVLAFAMDEKDIEAIIAWPHTVIASDGDSEGAHPRGHGAFSRFLGHYVRERGVLSLEEAVRRITSLPAQQVGILERGQIQPGYFADLVLFDPATIASRATFDHPHRTSTGVAKVWVNGMLVLDNGESTGNRPGMPVRRGDRNGADE